jgi:hypothetical protein
VAAVAQSGHKVRALSHNLCRRQNALLGALQTNHSTLERQGELSPDEAKQIGSGNGALAMRHRSQRLVSGVT